MLQSNNVFNCRAQLYYLLPQKKRQIIAQRGRRWMRPTLNRLFTAVLSALVGDTYGYIMRLNMSGLPMPFSRMRSFNCIQRLMLKSASSASSDAVRL